MDFSWLATAGPYGGLVLVIGWLSRTVISDARRHGAEFKRIDEERKAEVKRLNDLHEAELRRINADYERDVNGLRTDMAELRADIVGLRAELRAERDARRDAEELAHRLRMGDLNAVIDASEARTGLHGARGVTGSGDPGIVAGPRHEDGGDRPGVAGDERLHDRPGRRDPQGP